jgi:hypothetical protein
MQAGCSPTKEKPLRLSSNAFFFHGDLWSEEELRQRWHITTEGEPAEPDAPAIALPETIQPA